MSDASKPNLVTRLRNGLEVRLKEIHTAPLATCWVWYRVGSRNETPGTTGVSHWVEHMQFKGTPSFPAGVLDRAISRNGGVWNAFTWLDWTAYLETLPADRIKMALELEADRMQNSLFDVDEVESERTVIIAERQGHENEPTFRLAEEVQAASFRVHGYHHGVIGDMVDLQSMTRDDLFAHYRLHYVPSNAVLVVAGDFNTRRMLNQIREIFGPLPKAPVPQHMSRPEPLQSGERIVNVSGPGGTHYLKIAYHAPAAKDDDFLPLTVLGSVLAGASSFNFFAGGYRIKHRVFTAPSLMARLRPLFREVWPHPLILISITSTSRCAQTGHRSRRLPCWIKRWPVFAKRRSMKMSCQKRLNKRVLFSHIAAKVSAIRGSGWVLVRCLQMAHGTRAIWTVWQR